jgi:hypothetical protein
LRRGEFRAAHLVIVSAGMQAVEIVRLAGWVPGAFGGSFLLPRRADCELALSLFRIFLGLTGLSGQSVKETLSALLDVNPVAGLRLDRYMRFFHSTRLL